jgi:hypothetical protein
MIYAALQPFAGTNAFDFDISDFIKDNYQIREDIDKYALSGMLRSAEKAIEDILSEEAEAYNIKAKFRCQCTEQSDEIVISNICVYGDYDEKFKGSIENIITSLGFDKSIIIFEGDTDEHR